MRSHDSPDHKRRDETFREIAAGVWWRSFGLVAGNVYLIEGEGDWVLVDTSVAGKAEAIQTDVARLLGERVPGAIVLTHVHPDHAGSARALAEAWRCPVLIHPAELPLAIDRRMEVIRRFANPLDRGLILPILRAVPAARRVALLESESLATVARPLDVQSGVPGLCAFSVIETPGHSPGHIALFRARDRVLVAGDAVLTVAFGCGIGRRPRIAAPPWFTNWDPAGMRASLAVLAALEPAVLASGHGTPMALGLSADLRDLAVRLGGVRPTRAEAGFPG